MNNFQLIVNFLSLNHFQKKRDPDPEYSILSLKETYQLTMESFCLVFASCETEIIEDV